MQRTPEPLGPRTSPSPSTRLRFVHPRIALCELADGEAAPSDLLRRADLELSHVLDCHPEWSATRFASVAARGVSGVHLGDQRSGPEPSWTWLDAGTDYIVQILEEHPDNRVLIVGDSSTGEAPTLALATLLKLCFSESAARNMVFGARTATRSSTTAEVFRWRTHYEALLRDRIANPVRN